MKIKKNIKNQVEETPHAYHAYHEQENSSIRFNKLWEGLDTLKVDPPIDRLLSFDFEWSLSKDEYGEFPILAFSYCDSQGNRNVLLLEDYLHSGYSSKIAAEEKLISTAVEIITNYKWSMGYYTTGVRAFDISKKRIDGKDSDLIQLHKRLLRYNLDSPIYISKYTKRPYLSGFNRDHNHIDVYNLFGNQMIKSSVYGNIYTANGLDSVSLALLGDQFGGKYHGLTGPDFEFSTNLHDKRLYAFKDALLPLQCVALKKYELFHVIAALSELTGMKFLDICHSKGVGKIWNTILDKVVAEKLSAIEQSSIITNEDEYLYYSLSQFYDRKKFVYADNIYNDDDNNDSEESNNKKSKTRFIGGWIYDKFEPGVYENVIVFDVASLYPTMIVNNKISFDTVNCQCCKENDLARVPVELFDKNIEKSKIPWICKIHDGILTEKIISYKTERLACKTSSKNKLLTEEERNKFKNKSDVYKILMNSIYGQMGARYAKYENVVAAELVTRFGRITIQKCAKIAQEIMHWNIIYGDTDSLFITNSDTITNDDVKKFILECKLQSDIDIEAERRYNRLLINGKKNYIGYTEDGKIIVKGVIGKKTTVCLWTRNVFKKLLENIKYKTNPIPMLNEAISELESRSLFNLDTASLFIHSKELRKNPDEYKQNGVQKIIGNLTNKQEGETIFYYKGDEPEKYTQDITKASVNEYVSELISASQQILKLLGHDVKKELLYKNKNNSRKNNTDRHKRNKVMNSGIDKKDLISLKDKRLCNFIIHSASLEIDNDIDDSSNSEENNS